MSQEQLTQLSQQANQINALTKELTETKRAKYRDRINGAFAAGKCTKPRCDALLALVDTFQFSADAPQTRGELDFRLEEVESQPSGAAWTDDERIKQFSLAEERPSKRILDGDDISDADVEELVNKLHPLAKAGAGEAVAVS